MILVSRTMFLGSRNQIALFILMINLSVCPSIRPSSPPSDHQSVALSLSVFGWSLDLSVRRPVCLSVHLPLSLLSLCLSSVCLSVCLSVPPLASPTVCLVFVEVNLLTVTGDCSCLVVFDNASKYSITVMFDDN